MQERKFLIVYGRIHIDRNVRIDGFRYDAPGYPRGIAITARRQNEIVDDSCGRHRKERCHRQHFVARRREFPYRDCRRRIDMAFGADRHQMIRGRPVLPDASMLEEAILLPVQGDARELSDFGPPRTSASPHRAYGACGDVLDIDSRFAVGRRSRQARSGRGYTGS